MVPTFGSSRGERRLWESRFFAVLQQRRLRRNGTDDICLSAARRPAAWGSFSAERRSSDGRRASLARLVLRSSCSWHAGLSFSWCEFLRNRPFSDVSLSTWFLLRFGCEVTVCLRLTRAHGSVYLMIVSEHCIPSYLVCASWRWLFPWPDWHVGAAERRTCWLSDRT